MTLADGIASASRTLLAILDPTQADALLMPFDDEERRAWAYTPKVRRGVPLWALDRDQAKAAHRLLATLLTSPTHAQALTIMGFEEVLDRIEGYSTGRRHAGDYWLALFGIPDQQTWGVRWEGHHVSIHATICSGEVRLTPLFLGANPAIVSNGSQAVLAPLGLEESLGFELLKAMSPTQRARAVISDVAPGDVLTGNQPRAEQFAIDEGVPLTMFTGTAVSAAHALVDVYLQRFPDGSLRPDPRDATFVWAGAQHRGVGHYYRIAGPRILIEFDNTQNGANHIHTVVRDPAGDFGDDVLGAHYRAAHCPGRPFPS